MIQIAANLVTVLMTSRSAVGLSADYSHFQDDPGGVAGLQTQASWMA